MRITPEYLEQQRQLHESFPTYGTSLPHYMGEIRALVARFLPRDILNYGCGKSPLKTVGAIPVTNYDPAIEAYDLLPNPADMVLCIDVLEHIEPECLDDVLQHLAKLTRVMMFATIATRPARKTLPDGRNAHLIVQGPGWWRDKLNEHFTHLVTNHLDYKNELFLLATQPKRTRA